MTIRTGKALLVVALPLILLASCQQAAAQGTDSSSLVASSSNPSSSTFYQENAQKVKAAESAGAVKSIAPEVFSDCDISHPTLAPFDAAHSLTTNAYYSENKDTLLAQQSGSIYDVYSRAEGFSFYSMAWFTPTLCAAHYEADGASQFRFYYRNSTTEGDSLVFACYVFAKGDEYGFLLSAMSTAKNTLTEASIFGAYFAMMMATPEFPYRLYVTSQSGAQWGHYFLLLPRTGSTFTPYDEKLKSRTSFEYLDLAELKKAVDAL